MNDARASSAICHIIMIISKQCQIARCGKGRDTTTFAISIFNNIQIDIPAHLPSSKAIVFSKKNLLLLLLVHVSILINTFIINIATSYNHDLF
jgi:hypothetical protein